MEKYAAILGFIAACLAGVHADSVQVNRTTYNVKLGESVSLSCLGSSNELDFYIINRVNWDFITNKGQTFPLTEGFYPTTSGEGYADTHFGSGHLEFEHSSIYIFKLKIKGIVDADDGTYRCSLVNASSQVVDYKDVTVTVMHPVEKVTLEIHNPKTNSVLVKKTTPAKAQDQAIELWPGAYMVKCVAEGSNPEPEVEFMYNQEKPPVNWKTDKDTSGDRVKYTKQLSQMAFPLQPNDMDQYLTCSANIAMGDYPAKTASIKMVVRGGSGTMITPLSLCIYLVLAYVTKQAFQRV